MSLFKNGDVWHFDFWFQKRHYQGSTFLKNKEKARLVENKVRTDAALEMFGLATPKLAPTFQEFAEGDFLAHVREHSKQKPRTVKFYEEKVRRLLESPLMAGIRLTAIDEKLIETYKQARIKQKRRSQGKGLIKPASVNRELATLSKALGLAYEWKLIGRVPRIRKLPGEMGRTFTLTGDMENAYLAAAPHPLKQAAILILDLGMRPEECVRIKKADVSDTAVRILFGKSQNAERILTLSDRAHAVLVTMFELWPDSPWVFPGQRKGTHLTGWALDNQHADVRRDTISPDGTRVFPDEFVVYSCRHTFGTRLAESGASPFAIKEAMGHSSVTVSEKYIHPSVEHVDMAMKRKEVLDKLMRGEGKMESGAVPELLVPSPRKKP